MSSGTSNKVNTSTQVEYDFVEPRSIVGQEDTAIVSFSKSSSSLSLRKQSKGIRPPLVGQASSSSNDSVSLSIEKRSTSIGNAHDRPMTSPTQNNTEPNHRNDLDNQKSSYLPSRSDYINQKPPEGSYCHIYTSSQTTESNHDLTRVRSSSSASSVTSSRPLEWDNGADVGYSQCHVISGKALDPNMSTVERMALVSSTKLLRRSDPEGTTGGTCPLIKNTTQSKMSVKNKFGHPNAESTPLGTHVASDVSPDTVDFISPIPYERREDFQPEINSSESEACEQTHFRPLQDGCTENQSSLSHLNEANKHKVSLFPEMSLGSYVLNDIKKVDMDRDSDENGLNRVKCGGRKNNVESGTAIHKTEVDINSKMQLFNNELKTKLESVDSLDIIHKKLSSSLENIYNINNNAPSNVKLIPSTLPRSSSQTNLYLEILSHENITNSKGSKGNIVLQNLFKNKSASSSSVATVVHRKGDSPKHALVQTSIFKKQSVGTQVYESIDRNTINSKPFTGSAVSETPHLPKAVLTQQLIKKSNYFDFYDDPNKYKNAPIDQSLIGANDNCEEKEFISPNLGTHFHNGILCRGAHKKNFVSDESPVQQFSTNFINPNNSGLDTSVSIPFASKKQRQSSVCSANFNKIKNVSGSIIDSVESSVKSGGCGTDKQYSVTVEDRVNSFEYLPGHVYENNERQQPIISCGTSSMSIENQTSNNATPEDQNKIWESSVGGSISSTFEKDAQRGVDILSEFVKGAYDNNTLLKRKLIKRVVDKLISKNHIDKKIKSYQDLMKNTPWVPPRPSNPVERNTIKTPKSKVPCEFSSHSEKSGTTNTSSECFIPKLADRNKCFPSFFRDDSCQKYQGELSSTSNVTPEKSAKSHDRSPKSLKLMDSNTQKIRKNHITKPNGNSSSNKVLRTNNWKEPATKTEKLIEERRKTQNESPGSHSSVSQLLDMERENQLFWIRSEIEHLSNLKLLLERQEELKRGLKNCKLRQSKSSERNVLKEKNRVEKDKTQAATLVQKDAVSKKSPLKTKSSHPPKLNEWLKDFLVVPKSQDIDLDGWASHHYENDENIKSCMKKKKSNHQTQLSQTRTPTVDKNYVIYDEPPISFQRRNHDLKPQKRSNATKDNLRESASTDEKDCNRRNVTEKLGQPTQVDRPRQRVKDAELGCQCLCQGKCKCCTKHTNTNTDDRKKEPLGYYIIFDNPKKSDETNMDQNRVGEIGITSSVVEKKQKPARQNRVERQRADNLKKKGKSGLDKDANSRKRSELTSPEPEPTSNESENDRNEINIESKKAIFKGGAGELQYHLLHNRPSYVSRAEDRRQCIAQMQYLRELSSQNKRRLLSLTQPDPPRPPPIKVQRVFSQHKMRQMTEKKYQQLSEVREKLQDTKKKESYRTNRLMAEIFKKNLQKRVLKGEVNLSNSVFVISSL